jgi:hypothetical protein
MVREQDPSALCLIETWADEPQLELIRVQLHFSNKLVVPRRNKGGGLALFWKQTLDLQISSYSYSHIDTIVDAASGVPWRFTAFYGAPESHRRELSWNLLRYLHGQFDLPWCCGGDFNEIVRLEEKQGQISKPESQMLSFREALDDCGFVDLGYIGSPFTWCNNRFSGATVWERLDRVVASTAWLSRFPQARVYHLDYTGSDHKPLWLSPTLARNRSVAKPFRFEEMWMTDSGCAETISTAWQTPSNGNSMYQVITKLNHCRNQLKNWSKSHFGSVRKQLQEKREELKVAEEKSMQRQPSDLIPSLRAEVSILLSKEERMWRQRSRTQWLKQGDRNTNFFHTRATHRQRRNSIVGLRDFDGEWQTDPDQVQSILISYFQNIFLSSNPSSIDTVLQCIPILISDSMNEALSRPYTATEVETALRQMALLTAPGPDGLPPIFFQNHWHLIGADVVRGVLSSLNSGKLVRSINHTNITLIPKVKNPERVSEYRPISLCNVLYKIISKVIANRLKVILPHMISETQSAFVPGRLITDNILVAFETLHHMQST